MLRGDVELDVRGRDFRSGLLLDLTRSLPDLRDGGLLALLSDQETVPDDLALWSQMTGHSIVERSRTPDGDRFVIRKGQVSSDPVEDGEARRRLWIYTNFHCNLACDYCCVGSSPTAVPDRVSISDVAGLAAEAPRHGIRRIILTGGEPFMRDDLAEVVTACAGHLPVTLLTNAMLFRGKRRDILERLPRDQVTLQVSLDSPTPELHDRHRGRGSWQAAWEGITLARSLGFRVRVAATCAHQEDLDAMDRFLAEQGVPVEDRVLRPLARLGEASDNDDALALARADVVPEITYTGRGVYWHPVGVRSDDFHIADASTPLEKVLEMTRVQLAEDRKTHERLAQVFVCS